MSDSENIEQGYRVMVDDNFHYMDESYRQCAGTFQKYEDALELAQKITLKSVLENESNTAEETFSNYTNFGKDPFIQPFGGAPRPSANFSAWTVAKALAQIIEDHQRQAELKG